MAKNDQKIVFLISVKETLYNYKNLHLLETNIHFLHVSFHSLSHYKSVNFRYDF